MLKRILFHIRQIIRGILSIPARLFGRGGPPLPPTADFEEIVDEQVEELRKELDAAAVPLTSVNVSLGGRIHEYASGDRHERGTFDFGDLPEHVAITLCCMSPDQLARLAMAGPEICGRWAEGERTGLVGVPLPKMDWLPTRQEQGEDTPALVPEGEVPSQALGLQMA